MMLFGSEEWVFDVGDRIERYNVEWFGGRCKIIGFEVNFIFDE